MHTDQCRARTISATIPICIANTTTAIGILIAAFTVIEGLLLTETGLSGITGPPKFYSAFGTTPIAIVSIAIIALLRRLNDTIA
tara:strand:+ start:292 stop:543 length:252 start_codon:yes stop_codon:yes gene_type:complete